MYEQDVWMSKSPTEILAAFQQRFRASENMGDGGGATLKPVHSNPKLPRVRGLNFCRKDLHLCEYSWP